jgi:hypothetical protein
MHRSLDKLVNGRAKQRRINDPTLFIGVHCPSPPEPIRDLRTFSIRSLTEH